MICKRSYDRRSRRKGLMAGLVLTLTGCGADLSSVPLQANAVTGYQASSMFDPAGHSLSALPDGRFRVTATGSAGTPKERVEKIAVARAAELGAEMHKKWVQTSAPQHTIRCAKRDYSERGTRVYRPKVGYAVVEVDATFADTAVDPSYKEVRGLADTLKAELQSEVVPPEVQAQAAAEVRSQCGI
jgi:hypothetical protein